jgi:hypothetical protein
MKTLSKILVALAAVNGYGYVYAGACTDTMSKIWWTMHTDTKIVLNFTGTKLNNQKLYYSVTEQTESGSNSLIPLTPITGDNAEIIFPANEISFNNGTPWSGYGVPSPTQFYFPTEMPRDRHPPLIYHNANYTIKVYGVTFNKHFAVVFPIHYQITYNGMDYITYPATSSVEAFHQIIGEIHNHVDIPSMNKAITTESSETYSGSFTDGHPSSDEHICSDSSYSYVVYNNKIDNVLFKVNIPYQMPSFVSHKNPTDMINLDLTHTYKKD